jgi:hypothetical protein
MDDKRKLKRSRTLFSGTECIRMAKVSQYISISNNNPLKMQNKYANPCKNASNGNYGSKFVSAVITGDDAGSAEVKVYQVSNQCMTLVKESIITPNETPTEGAELRVKKSSKKYVPDIMYSTVGEYGAQVIHKAEPTFPLDFFVIKIREGFPKTPKPFFKKSAFPVENRSHQDKDRSPVTVKTLLQNKSGQTFLEFLADFHLLLFLAKNVKPEEVEKLIHFVTSNQGEADCKKILDPIFKSVPAPSPVINVPSKPSTSTSQPSAPTNPAAHAKIKNELKAMGFTEAQITEALFVTNGVSFDVALEYLVSTK